jgi:hypothetical protein
MVEQSSMDVKIKLIEKKSIMETFKCYNEEKKLVHALFSRATLIVKLIHVLLLLLEIDH